jgi:hypothetical protein
MSHWEAVYEEYKSHDYRIHEREAYVVPMLGDDAKEMSRGPVNILKEGSWIPLRQGD